MRRDDAPAFNGRPPVTGATARLGHLFSVVHRVPAPSSLAAVASAVLFAALSVYLWSGNLDVGLSWLDDHQIVNYLGPDRRIAADELPELIALTVGESEDKEFRPVTYSLFLLETLAWKDAAASWHRSRLLLFALMTAAFAWVAARGFGATVGFALVLGLLTAPYWATIWARLMRTETYAGVGVALYLVGLVRAIESRSDLRARPLVWLLAGTLLAAGAKEPLAIVAVPTAILALGLWRRGELNVARGWLLGSSLAFPLLVLAALWREMAGTGTDYYGGAIDASRSLAAIRLLLAPDPVLLPVLATLALAGACRWAPRGLAARLPQGLAADLRVSAIAGTVCCLLYVSQLFVYGRWPLDSPYAFPGDLLRWGCWLALAWPFYRVLCRAPRSVALGMQSAVALGLLGFAAARGFVHYRAEIEENRSRSERFQAAIQRAVHAVKSQPDAVVVLWSRSWSDIEPAWGTMSFLAYEGLAERVLLDFEPRARGGVARQKIEEWERGGALRRWMEGEAGFAPLESLRADQACYALSLTSGSQPGGMRCESLGSIHDEPRAVEGG